MTISENANFLTTIVIMGSIMVTPIYVFATYVFSNASPWKGMRIGVAFLVFGAVMSWVCLSQLPTKLGLAGNFIVPVCWIVPSLILYWQRDWFLDRPLPQKWLVGLQVFRIIGALFLLEMVLGHIPGSFAYPAGIGDIIVGVLAAVAVLLFRNRDNIPTPWVLLVLWLGVADFISAFFFGFTSSDTPLQLFAKGFDNKALWFPTGMIPMFLVPYALFFHMLSFLSWQLSKREGTDSNREVEEGDHR